MFSLGSLFFYIDTHICEKTENLQDFAKTENMEDFARLVKAVSVCYKIFKSAKMLSSSPNKCARNIQNNENPPNRLLLKKENNETSFSFLSK